MTAAGRLTRDVLAGQLAVVRLPAGTALPAWFGQAIGPLVSVTRTNAETSLICDAAVVPSDAQAERGWRAIKVRGPLAFSLTGILAGILAPLAAAGISVFALSTYDTDYILVRATDLPDAVDALRSGYDIQASDHADDGDRR